LAALSPWLQLMLAEIARKRAECERAREEEARRARESDGVRCGSERHEGEKLPTCGGGVLESRPKIVEGA
jgi:hypothetical protein